MKIGKTEIIFFSLSFCIFAETAASESKEEIIRKEIKKETIESSLEKEEDAIRKKDARTDSEDSEAYFQIGFIHSYLGEEEEALRNYRKALEINPRLGEVYLERGITEYFLNNYGEARENFEKAGELFRAIDDFQRLQIVEEYLDKLYRSE